MKRFISFFLVAAFGFYAMPVIASGSKSIVDFGAIGDGKTLNTNAIQQAINTCALKGVTVVVPKGTFLTGSLKLLNGSCLYLESGAIILGSTNISDYADMKDLYDSYSNLFARKALFYAEAIDGITIKGEGMIDGQGGHQNFIVHENSGNDKTITKRPYIIKFVKCRNIKIDGIVLQNAAAWMQYYLSCDQVSINNVKVYNHVNFNNDGIDIDNCRNVIISNCFIDADDDAICLKSTNPTEKCDGIVVSNCVIQSNCNGFKIGTDSQGGFQNITVSNCVFKRASKASIWKRWHGQAAVALEVVDGGAMERVKVSGITVEGYATPLFIRLGNRGRKNHEVGSTPNVGYIRDIVVSDVVAEGISKTGSSITGIKCGIVENISLSNFFFRLPGGGTAQDAARIPGEVDKAYPEYSMFGSLPSYGFFIRNAGNIRLSNIQFELKSNEQRPALWMENVKRVVVKEVIANGKTLTEGIIETEFKERKVL